MRISSSTVIGGITQMSGSMNIGQSKPIITNQHNFVSNPTLPAFLTLSRLSAATRFDNTGNLVDTVIDEPRFDYAWDGSSWINQGLLVEKQSTNVVSNSDRFSNPVACKSTPTTFYRDSSFGTPSALRGVTIQMNVPVNLMIYYSEYSSGFGINKPFSGVAIGGDSLNNDRWSWRILNTDAASKRVRISNSLYRFTGSKINQETKYVWQQESTFPIVFEDKTETTGSQLLGVQVEQSGLNYSTSFIRTQSNTVTRTPDNIQLNLSSYTGSIKLTYKRQDTEVVETKWLDLTNATNPIISSGLPVGIWLQNIRVYNRILTAQEKSNA